MNHHVSKVLIVDDDEGHAILIRENLEAAGLQARIEHLSDGQLVLDYFARGVAHPDTFLVLLDIRMPKVDGIEVLRRLKSDPALVKLPVIMLTTTDDTREINRCYALGCNGYIQKPVDYEKFADVIRNLALFVPLLLIPAVGAS